MSDQITHRCFACDPPLHASFWTTWAEASETDLRSILAREDFTPTTLRQATAGEVHRFTGSELDDDRALWIAFDPVIR